MHTKIHITPFLVAILSALIVGAGVATYFLFGEPGTMLAASAQYAATTTAPLPALPLRLRIPALNIRAHVQQVGRTAAGLMASPTNFTDVGWYTGDARPGQAGTAVMAGHVDNALALDGVFKHLKDLKVGDDVYVDTAEDILRFRVIRTEVYPYDRVPLDELFRKTGGTYLNLVTCGGTWLPKQRTYDHRLVVYTELIG